MCVGVVVRLGSLPPDVVHDFVLPFSWDIGIRQDNLEGGQRDRRRNGAVLPFMYTDTVYSLGHSKLKSCCRGPTNPNVANSELDNYPAVYQRNGGIF